MGESYKKSDGEEIMLGQDIYGTWQVSCWNKDLDCLWEKRFDKESEAREEFERWRN